MAILSYKEQLAHPLWQKKRLEILQRDNWTCQICLDKESQLQIHHKFYDKTFQTMAWEYPNHCYKTLCLHCHVSLSVHVSEYNTEEEFDLMKIKEGSEIKIIIVYSKGKLIINPHNSSVISVPESANNKIVQFLINNWLKNG